jgi:hypothetical protein
MGHRAVAYTSEGAEASPFARFLKVQNVVTPSCASAFFFTLALLVLPAARASAAESSSEGAQSTPSHADPVESAHSGPQPGVAELASTPGTPETPAAVSETAPSVTTTPAATAAAPAAPYSDPAPKDFDGVWMGTTYHTRSGWFARLNVGASYLHIFRSANSSQAEGTEAFTGSSSVDTVLRELELTLGGTLWRDIGLGLVARIGEAPTAELSTDDESIESLDLRGGIDMEFLGLGTLIYLDPESGWFLGASLGFESWRARAEESALDEIGGNGVGLSLLGGYDFWLGGNLALGVLARFDAGVATGSTERQVSQDQLQDQLQGSETDYWLKGALAATLTYY